MRPRHVASDPADDASADAASVEAAAVRLLAMREHTRSELRRKLARRFDDPALIDSVLTALQQQNLLSDERFTESYVSQRARRGYGPLRIRAELAERGVDGGLAARWLDDGTDWAELMTQAAAHKFGEQPAADQRELARRGRFLQQRGFPPAIIHRYLDRVRPR